jgi:hypothetical protein
METVAIIGGGRRKQDKNPAIEKIMMRLQIVTALSIVLGATAAHAQTAARARSGSGRSRTEEGRSHRCPKATADRP